MRKIDRNELHWVLGRRGKYTEADARSLLAKLAEPSYPGKVIPVTDGELAASMDIHMLQVESSCPSNLPARTNDCSG
jgi:hypothetical protein